MPWKERQEAGTPERAVSLHHVSDGMGAMSARDPAASAARLDRVVAEARRAAELRGHGYRERALAMYPWICGRCAREFTRANVGELTVHHRNHNHDDNPADGSNWELLCLYCHDNEHSRYIDHTGVDANRAEDATVEATHKPFGNLKDLLKR